MKRLNRLARARPAQARKAQKGPSAAASEERVLEIAAMGARGDSTAAGPDGVVYAPYALPGERIRARVAGGRAEVVEILEASPDRQEAACRHFGRCGGCQ